MTSAARLRLGARRTSPLVRIRKVSDVRLLRQSFPIFPVLYSERSGLLHRANSFLVFDARYSRPPISSLLKEAEQLQAFFSFLDRKSVSLGRVDDEFLLRWVAAQEKRGISKGVIADRISLIIRLFHYLESRGWIQKVIALESGAHAPLDFVPKITTKPVATRRGNRRHRRILVRSTIEIARETRPPQPTPSEENISALYALLGSKLGPMSKRNKVMLDWFLQPVPRRSELLRLRIADLPTYKEAVRCELEHTFCKVTFLETKGGRPRTAPVSPYLILSTYEYIKNEREDVVGRFGAKDRRYREPEEVFLSSKTGRKLNERAVSNLFSGLLRATGAEGHLHRLRAAGIQDLLDAMVEAEIARLGSDAKIDDVDLLGQLIRLKEYTGHKSLEGLLPYLNNLVQRRYRDSDVGQHVALHQDIAAQRRLMEFLVARNCALKGASASPPPPARGL